MLYFSRLAFALLLSSLALARPGLIGTLDGIPGIGTPPPPKILLTDMPSSHCKDRNGGAYLCCDATVNGGSEPVKTLAALAGYTLPNSTINGIACMS
jgi:hypothetical protein